MFYILNNMLQHNYTLNNMVHYVLYPEQYATNIYTLNNMLHYVLYTGQYTTTYLYPEQYATLCFIP